MSTSMTINATAAILLALYVAVAGRAGPIQPSAARSRTTSSRSTSPAGPTSSRPSLAAPDHRHVRLLPHQLPTWNTISISGYHMREAGSTAVQEVAFASPTPLPTSTRRSTLASPSTSSRRGYRSSSPLPDLLEEVAKFRAARRLWARLAQSATGPANARLRHALPPLTGGSTLPARRADNVVRTSLQALAAVLGGAQTLPPTPSTKRSGSRRRRRYRLRFVRSRSSPTESGVSPT